jgi:ligand-binding sensor domain-containing protein
MKKAVMFLCVCSGVLLVACISKKSPTGPDSSTKWTNFLHSLPKDTVKGYVDTIPDDVDAIVVDKAGLKWFGSSDPRSENVFSFLSTSTGKVFTGYNTTNGLPNSDILSMAIDSQGNKWVGFQGGGVSMFNGTTWTTYTANDGLVDPNNVVQSITIDKKGNQWLGTSAGFSERTVSGTWINYFNFVGSPDKWSDFNSNNVHCITFDSNGVLWIGNDVGVFYGTTKPGSDTVVFFDSIAPGNDTLWNNIGQFNAFGCNWITVDRENNKWLCTDIAVGEITAAGTPSVVYWGPYAYQSVSDKSGNVWVATSGDSGVLKFEPPTNQKSFYPGLASSNIFSIAVDSSGNIWAGSDQGIHELPVGK